MEAVKAKAVVSRRPMFTVSVFQGRETADRKRSVPASVMSSYKNSSSPAWAREADIGEIGSNVWTTRYLCRWSVPRNINTYINTWLSELEWEGGGLYAPLLTGTPRF